MLIFHFLFSRGLLEAGTHGLASETVYPSLVFFVLLVHLTPDYQVSFSTLYFISKPVNINGGRNALRIFELI